MHARYDRVFDGGDGDGIAVPHHSQLLDFPYLFTEYGGLLDDGLRKEWAIRSDWVSKYVV